MSSSPRQDFQGAWLSLDWFWLLRGTLNFFGCRRGPMTMFIAMSGTAACSGLDIVLILLFPAIQPLAGYIPPSRNLNNPGLPSPYPPGAQLFFRAVTAIHESVFTLKMAFVICDFGIALVLLGLLRAMGRGAHLVLAYAWNPLLAIEVAGSGHIDVFGAFLLVISVAALARRWRAIAAVALGFAVAVKFLPIVLLPLYWKRIRIRDFALAVGVVGLLYVPFINHGRIPTGSLGTYVRSFRFNGPVFAAFVRLAPAPLLAGLAVFVGLVTATWLRRAGSELSPDAFAWPMAAALLCAPAVFPWYLLWLLPFLMSASTLLIIVWTVSIIPTYIMWHLRALGHSWGALPGWAMTVEYECLAIAGAIVACDGSCGRRPSTPKRISLVRPGSTSHLLYPATQGVHPTQRLLNSPRRTSMKIASRFTAMGLMGFCVLVLAATCWAQERPPILEQIARAYGLDSYGKIEAIRYTWNADLPGLPKLSHTWEWEPKTGKVSYEGKDKDGKPVKVSYDSSQLNSQSDQVKNEIEPAFVNDNYWLLFPLHAYWDTSATVTDEGTKRLPIGAGSATLVSVKYPAEAGGYTPGDTWDLYVGKDKRIVQFVYHRGGPRKPSLVIATWTGYKKAGPLLISTEHRGTADGKPLHVSITAVAVKLTGSGTWTKVQ